MPLTISDEVLKQAGLSEREVLVEFACRLFEAGKLSLPAAAKLANLDRPGIERELFERHIPAYHITAEDIEQDFETLKKLRR